MQSQHFQLWSSLLEPAFSGAFGFSTLLISCQIRHGGRSAISGPMRYTAALVPIEDFEGKT
ncbi:hypothetical protein EJJ20_15345 [Pseudomonas poae]|jgi:hypothetical protein|uniref:hypothetical protein n=1 Tax=unclassified Pseudomonas TaxID=196821 RepID=UPI000F7CF909|nr:MULTISPECIES: hypothetical protein [unclassified Pseudomonas]AZP71197.1 hypothetical protein EJJ20_15345 [Pseudomonas poae]NWE22641.1 hypothetical protein [Pseudomonas sp. P7548]